MENEMNLRQSCVAFALVVILFLIAAKIEFFFVHNIF